MVKVFISLIPMQAEVVDAERVLRFNLLSFPNVRKNERFI